MTYLESSASAVLAVSDLTTDIRCRAAHQGQMSDGTGLNAAISCRRHEGPVRAVSDIGVTCGTRGGNASASLYHTKDIVQLPNFPENHELKLPLVSLQA